MDLALPRLGKSSAVGVIKKLGPALRAPESFYLKERFRYAPGLAAAIR